jgi:glycosyltransferase involved in cell wall biosynthesis
MRITILHSHFTAMGGAEILLTAQARWLRAAGHEVTIAALHTSGDSCAAQMQGFDVQTIGLPAGVRKMESLTPAMMPDLIARTRTAVAAAEVVMAYNYPAAPIAAAASDARRVWYACEPYRSLYLREGNPAAAARLAITKGSRVEDYATQQVQRRIARRTLATRLLPWTRQREVALKEFDAAGVRALDAVTSLSRYGANCVAAATGRMDASVVYPMVNFAAPAAPRRGLRREAPQIMVQTRLGIPKNIDTLIRAFALVRRAHPKAELHVVGSGARRAALEKLAAREAPGHVRFHGYLSTEDLDTLAAGCDIFAFAPVDEPFGMVFPEAASRGLLLVGSDHGGPREILDDGKVGALCDPFSPTSIADAINRTLSLSDADADAQRAAADVSVRARFGADVTGRQLEAFLRG